jgi:hypothetical protein
MADMKQLLGRANAWCLLDAEERARLPLITEMLVRDLYAALLGGVQKGSTESNLAVQQGSTDSGQSPTGRLLPHQKQALDAITLDIIQSQSRFHRAGREQPRIVIIDADFADIERRVLAHAVSHLGKGNSYMDLLAVWLAEKSPLVVDAERFATWLRQAARHRAARFHRIRPGE